MRLVVTERAAEHLKHIADYIAQDNAIAAGRVYQAIVRSMQRLPEFPHMGRPGRVSGTRELQISSLPYRIVYRVDADGVVVVAVFHDARDLVRALKDRLAK